MSCSNSNQMSRVDNRPGSGECVFAAHWLELEQWLTFVPAADKPSESKGTKGKPAVWRRQPERGCDKSYKAWCDRDNKYVLIVIIK